MRDGKWLGRIQTQGQYLKLCWSGICLLAAAFASAAPDVPGYRISTVAEGLRQPYGIAFLPDGELLITEKAGYLRRVSEGVLQAEPVSGVPEVYPALQGGLLDIALHPRFSDNRWVYLSLSSGSQQANATQVIRGRYANGQLHNLKVIYTAQPFKGKEVHFGARMTFLPDETLLVTVGDGFEYREQAQNLQSALGKIVRIDDEGNIPPDNPFIKRDRVKPEIWSYGHRNPQGIVYDASAKTIYAHEHGPMGGDELNQIQPGSNYGWPFATDGLDYSGAYVSPLTSYPGTEPPLVQWTPSLAPSGLGQCRNCQWPEWEGDLFVGMLAGKHVRRIHFQPDGTVKEMALFGELNARIREVNFGPDGALYLLLENSLGQVLKVEPEKKVD